MFNKLQKKAYNFSLFQPLGVITQLRATWFKTLEHSISYNTSCWPGKKRGKMRFQKSYTEFACSIIVFNDV